MIEITCNMCGQTKPETDFYVHQAAPTGRQTRCKGCWKISHSRSLEEKRATEEGRKKRSAWRRTRTLTDAAVERERRHSRKFATEHPEKVSAQRMVRRALSSGKLTRPDKCGHCGQPSIPFRDGRPSIQAHHHDYSKPLDVMWLCVDCHAREHAALKSPADQEKSNA